MLLNILKYLLVKQTLIYPLMAGGHWKDGLGSCGLRWYEALVGEEGLADLLRLVEEVSGGHDRKVFLAVDVVYPCVIVGGVGIYLVY